MDAKQLRQHAEHLFGKKKNLDVLWQEVANNFYPERAYFTAQREPGDEFASHLMTGYPVMARRDLANSIGAMLRKDKWFKIVAENEKIVNNDIEAKRYLDWVTERQFKLMHSPVSQLVRACKEGDNDFVAFGQAVISVEIVNYQHLLYRTWHLKDVAWAENNSRRIDTAFIKHKMTVRDICTRFRDKAHAKCQTKMAQGKMFDELECMWCVYPDDDGRFVSVHLDCTNDHIMEEVVINVFPFVIPRWQTVSESQYAYSPAVVTALPDARLIQAMTLTLLEAGELSVRPPMLATQEAIRSDVQLVAGGITWVDAQYDERLGEVLRPVSQDRSGFPAAFRIEETIRLGIADSFFLNKLNLPVAGDMTAYEVQQRIQEFIRNTLPLFQPIEYEYNAALCDTTFEMLRNVRAFGDYVPSSLQGQEVVFRFESPLQLAEDREKLEQFRAAIEMVRASVEVNPDAVHSINFTQALRDAVLGTGAPAEWLRTNEEVEEIVAAAQEQRAEQQAIAQATEMMKAMPKQAGAPARAAV